MFIGIVIFFGAAVLCIVGYGAMMRKRRHYEQTGEVD